MNKTDTQRKDWLESIQPYSERRAMFLVVGLVVFIGELTKGTNGAIDSPLNTLLEIERELTLRENL